MSVIHSFPFLEKKYEWECIILECEICDLHHIIDLNSGEDEELKCHIVYLVELLYFTSVLKK